jgi:hypothetical protein
VARIARTPFNREQDLDVVTASAAEHRTDDLQWKSLFVNRSAGQCV